MEKQIVREISVKDLIYSIMKKWRSILAAAFILALVLAGYRLVTGLTAMNNPDAIARAREQHQAALDEYETARSRLEAQVSRTKSAAEEARNYCERSVFMRIDPLNEWVGSLTLYVYVKNQPGPSQEFLGADPAGGFTAVYGAYLTGGELYDEISQQSSAVDKPEYMAEIMETEVDTDASTIRITCIGDSETFVQEMLNLMRQGLEKKHQELCTGMGEHDIVIPSASCYSAVDKELYEQQGEKLAFIEQYLESSQKAEQDLQALKEPESESLIDRSGLMKQTVKGAGIGLIGGALLMAFVYVLRYILPSTMKSDNDWKATGLPVLAHIRAESKKRRGGKIDAWIERHLRADGAIMDMEAGCRLAATNLCAILRGRGKDSCVLISDVAEETAKAVAEKLNGAGTGVTCVLAGDLLSDAGALLRLEKAGDVVLLGKNEETTLESIRRELTLLRACGKNAIGVIVLE